MYYFHIKHFSSCLKYAMYLIYDDNKYKNKTIFVTYSLIVINVMVFLIYQLDISSPNPSYEAADNAFFKGYSMLPAEILSGKDIIIPGFFEQSPNPVQLTLLTSIFMHGSIWHLLGNMFFLFVFGDNLESVLGPVKFLFFYLLCGVLASFLDILFVVLFDQNQYVLNLGASGAISGIVGGYMMMFPRNKIHILIPRLGFIDTPAFLWGTIWIITQLLGCISLLFNQSSGVAYAAHIGGAVAGFIMIRLFSPKKQNLSSITNTTEN